MHFVDCVDFKAMEYSVVAVPSIVWRPTRFIEVASEASSWRTSDGLVAPHGSNSDAIGALAPVPMGRGLAIQWMPSGVNGYRRLRCDDTRSRR